MKNIAIFASGSGTNAANIIKYFAGKKMAGVVLVLSNKPDAKVLPRAKDLNVPAFVFSNAEFTEGSLVLKKLTAYQVDFIVLAGFLSMIPASIISLYRDRIVNIHPALLPKYGGKGMYGTHVHQSVVSGKETESGITIHYVNERYDEGRIIFQAKCPVLSTDTPKEVESKVRALEYEHYPKVIENLLKK